MKLDSEKLKKILLDGNYLEADDFKRAEEYSQKNRLNMLEYLLSEGLLNKDLLGQAISEYFHIPYADLNSNLPTPEQVQKIPEETGRKYRIIIFSENQKEVVFATDSPEEPTLLETLKALAPGKKKIKIAYSLTEDIDSALLNYRQALQTRFSAIIEKQRVVAPEIIEEIFADALGYQSSDIHFEPEEEEIVVRFRVDGVLQEAGRIPKIYYENIVNRIKVKSHLRTDEHLAAQDGSMRYVNGENIVDMRVSIAPTLDGEKMVIRLLSHYVRGLSLTDLGLSEKDQKIIETAAGKPFGMILVVGPTGAGKTTTLYALVKKLNNPQVNITTIEDPVEYKVLGVNQIQVNTQTNLSFANGLKSIARQDPDIILVGEIRDTETAEIAVNAALTGHLLLSTFHANDAATGIPRLLDMAVEPFLLASTLNIILAQRLVRKICENCRASEVVKISELKKKFPKVAQYFKGQSFTLYRGKGCAICNHSGYQGRTAIFKLIVVTPQLQDLILQRPSTKQIWQLARQQGSHSLFEDGIEKAMFGITTIEEVLRVAEPPLTDNHYGDGKKKDSKKISTA